MRRLAPHPGVRTAALGLVIPLLLIGVWELSGRLGWVRPNLLPPPSAVLATIIDLAERGELWTHLQVTLVRVLLGFPLGAGAATSFGALTGYSLRWRRLLDPMLQGLRAIPSIAWVPLFILWLGIFEFS
jgi:sulfonate transport system permease protein